MLRVLFRAFLIICDRLSKARCAKTVKVSENPLRSSYAAGISEGLKGPPFFFSLLRVHMHAAATAAGHCCRPLLPASPGSWLPVPGLHLTHYYGGPLRHAPKSEGTKVN